VTGGTPAAEARNQAQFDVWLAGRDESAGQSGGLNRPEIPRGAVQGISRRVSPTRQFTDWF